MKDWIIEESGFHKDNITSNGNKFLVGNGYLGIRGTLSEYEKSEFPAINLAGIYDRVGDAWREPLNAPNGLYTYIRFEGKAYCLPGELPLNHRMALDYRHGIFYRDTKWDTGNGAIHVKAERFASLDEAHLIAMRYRVCSDSDGELTIYTGIDGEVWDINGPHYDEMILSDTGQSIQAVGVTHENKDWVCVCEAYDANFPLDEKKIITEGKKILRVLILHAKAGITYDVYKYISVYTSRDCPDFLNRANDLVSKAKEEGYASVLKRHIAVWENKWSLSEVVIDGDDAAMEALNYSIYHLHCVAPRHADNLSIAARGLSGQVYKGAVFWDTEMYMLDFFLFTEPAVAKALVKYRIDTLEGAKRKALSYGYEGAFYAWESQEGGYDACSDYNVTDVFTGRPMRTYFKDKQIHISSAVVYGMMRYIDYTGDMDILSEGGAEVILECARFYYHLLIKKVHSDRYELHDVIGPDEYHERINNNAYTNRMAKYTFDSAVRIITMLPQLDKMLNDRLAQQYDITALIHAFKDAALRLYIPLPDNKSQVIGQFDGYEQLEDVSLEELKGRLLHEKEYWGGAYGIAAHTKIIKQADVVAMLNLFGHEYREEILLKNWEYYEPRTEHGSSLSACMYAMLACKCHMPDRAYPLFMKSAAADLSGEGKQWAGLIYIGGTHPASAGGAYKTAIQGFGGIYPEDGKLVAEPHLPARWNKMLCKVIYRGDLYQIEITKKHAKISNLGRYTS